ncbi:hypothetical protein XENOCAPTIV_021489 [Xenoophorus captivus]|uniref:Uncharacterized protein n=1 Tax=Xenoophorus captivus TaxID=1517983 RepID=A0ABV0QT11_9TELE
MTETGPRPHQDGALDTNTAIWPRLNFWKLNQYEPGKSGAVKPRCAVLTMLKRLDKIRFRGPRTRDDFPDLGESPPASDNECNDEVQPKPRAALRDTEDVLRDPVSTRLSLIFVFHLSSVLCT